MRAPGRPALRLRAARAVAAAREGLPRGLPDRAQAVRAAAGHQQHARHHAVGRPRHPRVQVAWDVLGAGAGRLLQAVAPAVHARAHPRALPEPVRDAVRRPARGGRRIHARQSVAAPGDDRRQLRRARQPAARRPHLPDARGGPRACGQNENQRKLCRAEQMHVPPVRSTRREEPYEREGASTNPLQPKRDRGLPRPRVLESPGRF